MCSDEKRYEDGNDKNNNKDNDKKGKEDNELGQQGEISPLSTMKKESLSSTTKRASFRS
jgi:hypothetical protein